MSEICDRISQKRTLENNSVIQPFPNKNMLLEVTNACNHKCIFCANRKMSRKKRMIDIEFSKRILLEAYELGMREVGFYSTGEPLLNTHLDLFIQAAKNIGYTYVYITTNGALADLKTMKKLLAAGLDSIKFSINAINRLSYEFIHGSDDFNKVIRNLKELSEYRNTAHGKFKIFVSYISTKYTKENEAVIKEYFTPFCDGVAIMNAGCHHGLTIETKEYLMDEKEPSKKVQMPCSMPFKGVYITCEGYLTACCSDFQNYLAYADLNKVSLKDAWNNECIQKLRKQMLDGKVQNTLCYNCVYETIAPISPLDVSLATKIDDAMYNADEVANRVIQFKKMRGDE